MLVKSGFIISPQKRNRNNINGRKIIMGTEFSKKWEQWLQSKEGGGCSDIGTLTGNDSRFLINRLQTAFSAGWNGRGESESADKIYIKGEIAGLEKETKHLMDEMKAAQNKLKEKL